MVAVVDEASEAANAAVARSRSMALTMLDCWVAACDELLWLNVRLDSASTSAEDDAISSALALPFQAALRIICSDLCAEASLRTCSSTAASSISTETAADPKARRDVPLGSRLCRLR